MSTPAHLLETARHRLATLQVWERQTRASIEEAKLQVRNATKRLKAYKAEMVEIEKWIKANK